MVLGQDGSGGLNFGEFKDKIKELPTATPINLLKDDFDLITEGGQLLNEEGEFNGQQFEMMMRGELIRYAQRQMSFALQESDNKDSKAMMLMLKLMETILTGVSAKLFSGWW